MVCSTTIVCVQLYNIIGTKLHVCKESSLLNFYQSNDIFVFLVCKRQLLLYIVTQARLRRAFSFICVFLIHLLE